MYRKIRKCIGKFLQKLSNYMLYGSNYEILCAADIDERVETIENIAESRGVEIDKEALLDALIGSIVPKTEEDCAELWTLLSSKKNMEATRHGLAAGREE